MAAKRIRVAIVGQPNVGKSALFNVLTGGSVHVANWPGTTVEKHHGTARYRGYELEFTDLPGIYGLGYQTVEEKIARDFISSGEYDVLLLLVDSIYPERTLHLVVEVLELTRRAIVVLTKIDESHKHGVHVNVEGLSRELEVPVIPVSCKTRQGVRELLEAIIEVYERGVAEKQLLINYGELEPYVGLVEKKLREVGLDTRLPIRWVSVRFLERDVEVDRYLRSMLKEEDYQEISAIREKAHSVVGEDLFEVAAFYRRHHVSRIISKHIVRSKGLGVGEAALSKALYNPFIGGFVSIAFYVLVFLLIFQINTGFPLSLVFSALGLEAYAELFEKYCLSSLIEEALSTISSAIYGHLGENVYTSFLVEGVVGGVGAVLLFIPLILVVSLVLAIVEDSGLAPRFAVAMHSLLSRIGLSGHAVFPIMVSYGCNVPGVLVTRASLNPLERLRLILTLSFIPCQARLVVILAVASTLSLGRGFLLIALTYIVSLVIFIASNKLLLLLINGRGRPYTPELLLEIPPLHKPLLRVVWWNSWSLTKHFITKAGLVILTSSVVVWGLVNISPTCGLAEDPSQSVAAQISRGLTMFFEPIGVSGENSWVVSFSVITGFIAKEMYISSLLVSSGKTNLEDAFRFIGLNDIQVIALTLFVVLYIPCLATIATIYSETRSVKYTALAVVISLMMAYVTMLLVYKILMLLTALT